MVTPTIDPGTGPDLGIELAGQLRDALEDAVEARIRDGALRTLRTRAAAVRGCAAPIHLDGIYRIDHAHTGALLHERRGRVAVPCGNRRESVCPACSDRYAADAFHLTRAGLSGGKTVPDTVTQHPMLFLTLTAPTFGPVHSRSTTASGLIRRCRCGQRHHEADTRVGAPIDPDSYDYTGAALWQAHASPLWNRTTVLVRRALARAAGIKVGEIGAHVRVSFAKVAEYQRRGQVHFHAVVRLDGPDGPTEPPPAWATVELLEQVVHHAAQTASVRLALPDPDHPAATASGVKDGLTFTWGSQVDTRPITPDPPELAHSSAHSPGQADDKAVSGEAMSAAALAGYIAKYATKGTGATDTAGTADRRIHHRDDIDRLPVSLHHRRLIATCWDLGAVPGLERLRRWAHMLGFGGHFLTKSRRYSTTFEHLRNARRLHNFTSLLDQLGVATEDDVVVINHWTYTGTGWNNPADRELAIALHEPRRAERRARYRTEHQSERQEVA